MINIGKNFLRALSLIGLLLIPAPYAFACNCSTASLLGSQISVSTVSNTKKTVAVTNSIEFPNTSYSMEINSNNPAWNIDVKGSSIIIYFNHNAGAQNYGMTSAIHFTDIDPQMAAASCGAKIFDVKVTSNKANSGWLNIKRTFSDHEVHVGISKDGSPVTNWNNNEWIRIDLAFDCSTTTTQPPAVKKGMTWGFGGISDIWKKSGGVWSQACGDKLYHATFAKLACETFPVNSPKSNYCGMDFSIYQPNATSHILKPPPYPDQMEAKKCDPYNGDTACSEERYVLCIAEDDNPYYNRTAPYATNTTAGQLDYSPYSVPPYARPSYKMHPPSQLPAQQPIEYFDGWVDQPVKLSRNKVKGEDLGGLGGGDQVCGPGWRMAEFNDGEWIAGMDEENFNRSTWFPNTRKPGGWAFHGVLAADFNAGPGHHGDSGRNARKNFFFERYWVYSPHGGNCWN